MADLFQLFGNDFQIAVNGDLLSVDGIEWTQQRIIRRLLTNPGTYLFSPTYGAGLGRYIGKNLSPDLFDEIKTNIISQILLEDAVAKSPKPIVRLGILQVQNLDVLTVEIEYFDLPQQQKVLLSFKVQP